MKHPGPSCRKRRGVSSGIDALTGRFDADEVDLVFFPERVEDAHGVRTSSNARHHGGRQPARTREHLLARLVADDGLEITNDARER